MKTFFCIDITINGEHLNTQIQSTKLYKIGITDKYGTYSPKTPIICGGFEFYFTFLLTYNVEMYGVVGKPKKQRRYTLYHTQWMTYKRDINQMLHNVTKDSVCVTVSVREEDLTEEGTIILRDQR